MKLHHVLAAAACLLVVVGIVAGFTITGSPSHAREVTLDNERVNNLEDIAARVRTRAKDTGEFPATLPPIWATDPVTKQPYGYKVIDASHFMLCASFAAPSERGDTIPGTEFWNHGAGQKCYTLDKSSEPILPVR